MEGNFLLGTFTRSNKHARVRNCTKSRTHRICVWLCVVRAAYVHRHIYVKAHTYTHTRTLHTLQGAWAHLCYMRVCTRIIYFMWLSEPQHAKDRQKQTYLYQNLWTSYGSYNILYCEPERYQVPVQKMVTTDMRKHAIGYLSNHEITFVYCNLLVYVCILCVFQKSGYKEHGKLFM